MSKQTRAARPPLTVTNHLIVGAKICKVQIECGRMHDYGYYLAFYSAFQLLIPLKYLRPAQARWNICGCLAVGTLTHAQMCFVCPNCGSAEATNAAINPAAAVSLTFSDPLRPIPFQTSRTFLCGLGRRGPRDTFDTLGTNSCDRGPGQVRRLHRSLSASRNRRAA